MKTTVFQMRLDPQKKARRMLLAKEMGVSLAEWIEMASEAFEGSAENRGALRRLATEAMDRTDKTGAPNPDTDTVAVLTAGAVGPNDEPRPYLTSTYSPPPGPGITRIVPVQRPFERKPVGKIAKMLKEKG